MSRQDGNTAVHLAAQRGNTEVLQKVVETGVDVDERNIVSELDWTVTSCFI